MRAQTRNSDNGARSSTWSRIATNEHNIAMSTVCSAAAACELIAESSREPTRRPTQLANESVDAM
ncbi:hypothetical protein KXD40_001275 [Peronospora effusa]|uniref:Uncharacterized protein n=1 Tax=Peronospora effusa TaxID=542832 RepID=A0A3M6VAK6_9STRA|nr:hypothetical protein DD238_008108 [Peronospora effusa]RQM12991.1 hypothetical protein DD237_007957 [Peronospora effusa]UIZ20499.1 hypothetical protein KXD40_001275 [Peronospora effusa]